MRRVSSAPRTGWASAALLLALVPLGGCGEDESTSPAPTPAKPSLSVMVAPAETTSGSTVKASVVNDSDEEFTYGAGYELERQVGNAFEKVKLPERPVIQIGYVAPPGETGPPVEVQLPKDLAPGTYRVVIQRHVPDVGDLSGQFEIVGDY
jgi:hypothetical protein